MENCRDLMSLSHDIMVIVAFSSNLLANFGRLVMIDNSCMVLPHFHIMVDIVKGEVFPPCYPIGLPIMSRKVNSNSMKSLKSRS